MPIAPPVLGYKVSNPFHFVILSRPHNLFCSKMQTRSLTPLEVTYKNMLDASAPTQVVFNWPPIMLWANKREAQLLASKYSRPTTPKILNQGTGFWTGSRCFVRLTDKNLDECWVAAVLAPVCNIVKVFEVFLILRHKAGSILGRSENGSLLGELLIKITNVFRVFHSWNKWGFCSSH